MMTAHLVAVHRPTLEIRHPNGGSMGSDQWRTSRIFFVSLRVFCSVANR
jgi:hypothetical protein